MQNQEDKEHSIGKVTVKVVPDLKELHEALKEVEELKDKLWEAKELLDSLASKQLVIRIDAEVDGNTTEWARVTG